jgi:site-specific DNA-cytosine methylase
VQLEFTVAHLFSGLGGCAIGFQNARKKFGVATGCFKTITGIDIDESACVDFYNLTGVPPVSANIADLSVQGLLQATKGACPDVVFLSPPCKGFSSLLSNRTARSEKYQALNRLVPAGLFLVVEGFPKPPKFIVLENVPRIVNRGAELLHQVRLLLGQYGYQFHEGFHDCGEVGGLAQRRRRYLMVARHAPQVPNFAYHPPSKRVRAIGEVLEQLPPPDHPDGGPLHRLPRLQWKTWIRLALIPAGGDWRDLPDDGPYAVVAAQAAVDKFKGRPGLMGVADWTKATSAVTGSASVSGSNGVAAVADPRVPNPFFKGKYTVMRWADASRVVIGGPSNGASYVADPRVPPGTNWHNDIYRVMRWDQCSGTVTGSAKASSGAFAVADPRLGCSPRAGAYGVIDWERPSPLIPGSADVHASASAVADPRVFIDTEQPDPPPVIIAEDGTWHRPLTTLELAALQDLPLTMYDGSPLILDGRSQAKWRERIGNAVPPSTAEAVAESLLHALMEAYFGAKLGGHNTDVWVRDGASHGIQSRVGD